MVLYAVVVLILQNQDESESESMQHTLENTLYPSEQSVHPSVTEKVTVPSHQTIPFETESKTMEHTTPEETEELPTISSDSEKAETLPQITIVQEPVSQQDVDAYAPVIQQYQEAILMDPHEFVSLEDAESELGLILDAQYLKRMAKEGKLPSFSEILEAPTLRDRFPYVAGTTLYHAKIYSDEETFDTSVYHYAYYNIDGIRSHELLIGAYDDYHDAYSILAVYTLYDDEPELLHAISNNARFHITIYTDGTICVDGSGGAAVHYWNYYRLNEMFDSSEPIDSFTINYDTPRSEYMREAVAGYEALLTAVDDIQWIPIMEG